MAKNNINLQPLTNKNFEIKIEELEYAIKEIKAAISELSLSKENTLGFSKLKNDTELYAYCHTFYWSALNLLHAYRFLNTGIIQGKTQKSTGDKIKGALNFGASVGIKVTEGIPAVGTLISIVNKVVTQIVDKKNEVEFNNKVKVINQIIQSKFITEDEISIRLARFALDITEIRRNKILLGKENTQETNQKITFSTEIENRMNKAIDYFRGKKEKVEEKIFKVLEFDKTSFGTQLALKDTILFTAFILQHYSTLLETNLPLSDQLKYVMQSGILNLIKKK